MSSDATRYVLFYAGPTDAPEVRINNESNLFLPGVNIYQFIENLSELLSIVNPDIIFEPSYPDWIINHEVGKELKDAITWEVSMQPAKLGGQPKPGSATGIRELKPRLRAQVEAAESVYMVEGQMFDAFFDFTIWAQTASRAEKLTQWFQFSFMPHYGSLLGSDLYYFHERKQDKELLKINNLLQTRTLTYYVKLAVNTAIEAKKIQEIKLKLDSQ